MKKGSVVLILAILAVAVFSIPAFADESGCCMGQKMCMGCKMMGGMRGKMDKKMDLDEMFFYKVGMIKENAVELGISDDQMQKVKMLKSGVKKSQIKNDADVDILVIDIEEMLMKDEVDVAGVNALIDKKYNVKSMAAKSLVAAYADLKKLLTKDQMKKLGDIWKKQQMDDDKCMMDGKKEREQGMGMGKGMGMGMGMHKDMKN